MTKTKVPTRRDHDDNGPGGISRRSALRRMMMLAGGSLGLLTGLSLVDPKTAAADTTVNPSSEVVQSTGGFNFTPPPAPYGISALNQLLQFCVGTFVWLDSEHTVGGVPNHMTNQHSPLSWKYLTCSTSPTKPPQTHSFEPNEMKKIAPLMLDIHNFSGGLATDPKTGVSFHDVGIAALRTSEAFTTPSSRFFCNFLTDWKDQSILGYPTPYRVLNLNPGYSFTPSGCTPSSTQMRSADGQLFAVYSAAAHASGTINPARHATDATTSRSGTTYTIPDESMFQAMNRFIRQDWATCKSILDSATADWDGVGFSSSYRGEYLGMYLAITRIVAPVLRQKGHQLSTFDSNDHSSVWTQVESVMWQLWQLNRTGTGGGIPGNYKGINKSGINIDNETNIAGTYPYAFTWHQKVRNVALSGAYSLTSPPGVPGNNNSIVVNGQFTPDGSPIL